MAKRIEVFSTEEDVRRLLIEIQQVRPLWYVKTGTYNEPSCPIYTSATQILNLGKTMRPDRTSSERYMIFPSQVSLVFREVIQSGGNQLFMLDAWKNPPCVLYTCGGVYEGVSGDAQCLIAGLVETSYKDSEVAGLYSLFLRSVKRLYTRFQRTELDSYVGSSAMKLLRSGWRLTESCSSPPTLDLT